MYTGKYIHFCSSVITCLTETKAQNNAHYKTFIKVLIEVRNEDAGRKNRAFGRADMQEQVDS